MALLSQLFFSECLLGGLKEAMRRCPSQDRSNQPDYADVQPAPILVNGQRSSTLCTGRQWDRFLSWHWPVLSIWSASSHAWVLQSEVPVPLEPSTSCRHWFAHGHPDTDLTPQTELLALQLFSSVPEDCPSTFRLLVVIVAAWTYWRFFPSTSLMPVTFNRDMSATF